MAWPAADTLLVRYNVEIAIRGSNLICGPSGLISLDKTAIGAGLDNAAVGATCAETDCAGKYEIRNRMFDHLAASQLRSLRGDAQGLRGLAQGVGEGPDPPHLLQLKALALFPTLSLLLHKAPLKRF